MKTNDLTIQEVWKAVAVKELADHYEASPLGRLRRSAGGQGTQAGRIICGAINGGGYVVVILSTGGVEKAYYLHRLIALTFIDNPDGKREVNHLSGIKRDCSKMNLAWATRKENKAHAAMMGLTAHGEQVHSAKLTSKKVANIRTEMAGVKGHQRAAKVRKLATRYGVSPNTIRNVAKGRTWKHCLPNQERELPVAIGGQLERLVQTDKAGDMLLISPGDTTDSLRMVV